MSGDGAYEGPKHVALLINAVRIVMLDGSIYGNIDTECVYCAVHAEPLNKYNTYGISCNSANINFRISTGTQHRPPTLSTFRRITKLINTKFSPIAQILSPCCIFPTFHFPSRYPPLHFSTIYLAANLSF